MKVNETKDGAIVRTPFYTVELLRLGGRIGSLARAGGREFVCVRSGGMAKELECGYPGQMAADVFQQDVLPSDGRSCQVRYTYHGRPGFFMGWSMKEVKTFTFREDSPVIRVDLTLQNVGAQESFAAFRIHNELVSSAGSVFIVPTVEGLQEISAETPDGRFVSDFTAGLAGVWSRNAREAMLFLPDYDTVDKFLFSGGPNRATVEWYCRSFSIGNGGSWSTSYLILPTRLESLDRLPSVLSTAGLNVDTRRRDRRPQAPMAVQPERQEAGLEPLRFFQRTVAGLAAQEAAMTAPGYRDNVPLPCDTVCSRVIHTRPGAGFEVTLPDDETVAVEAECCVRMDGPGQVEACLGCCDPEGNLHAVSASATLDFWQQTATLRLPVGELAGKKVRLFLFGKDVLWPSVSLSLASAQECRSLFSSLRVQTPDAEEPVETDATGKAPMEFVARSAGEVPRVEYWIDSPETGKPQHRTVCMRCGSEKEEGRAAPLLQKTDNSQCSSVVGALCAPETQETTHQNKTYSVRIAVPANRAIFYRVTAGSESVAGKVCRPGHLVAMGLPKKAVRLYVSPAGDDSFTGRLPAPAAKGTDGPFATLERAQMAVRKLTRGGKPSAPVAVIIRAGTYELNKPLTFGPEDSGSADCPILWTAAPGETVVISGGRRLSAAWTPAGDGIYTCRLSGSGKKKTMFREFFVNGKRMPRARWPLNGYFKLGAYTDSSRQRMLFNPSDLRDVHGLDDADFVLHFVWNEMRFRLKSMDAEKGVLTLDAPLYPHVSQDRYYVENVPAGLAAEGAWHFDPHTALLSWHPPSGVNPAEVEAVVPHLRELVRFRGRFGNPVRHIGLRGLTFTRTDWSELESGAQAAARIGSVVSMINTEFCRLRNNRVLHVGTYGIGLYKGCRRISLVGNEIAFAGAGGIRIGATAMDRTTRQNIVLDNDIHDCGQVYPSAIGVWIGQSSDNLLRGNRIHHLPYTGISVGWTWGSGKNTHARNRIERNTVHHVMQLFHDGGGIYSLGVSYGATVKDNVIRDVAGSGNGIYLDEGSTGMRVSGNIVSRCPVGLMLHGARDNLLENNVIADIQTTLILMGNCQSYMGNNCFRRNIFCSNSDALLIHATGWTRNFVIGSGENRYFRADGKPFRIEGVPGIATLEKWIAAGYETNPRLDAPPFVDPANGDYRVLPASQRGAAERANQAPGVVSADV